MSSNPVIAHRLFAPLALTRDGFCPDVTISIDAGGDIVAVESGRAEGCEAVRGPVIPGMANVHSHAFQRAMVGLTQRAGPGADDFWTWREVMYRFVAAVEPEDVEAIAAGLCLDMLKSGFTTVGEFHYLHNAPDGGAYADTAEMSERIVAAAGSAGMALTLLPALYQHGGFGGGPLHEGQRRFALDTGAYLRLVETLAARHGSDPNVSIGVAPHSLRAVGPEALREAIAGVAALSPDAPVHIHAAEQTREVEDCLAWSGARPVAWLADHVGFDRRWCVIHSTHTDPAEKQALATAGAVVGLCPTTEADLGDGIFDLAGFEAAGGRFGIGTDSNVSASPAAELRQLEWSQRLATRRRLVAGRREGASIGTSLYTRALEGGAQALGRRTGAIAPGCRADLVVLDAGHPLLAGRRHEAILDTWIFATGINPVRDVMAGGRWVIRERRHPREERILAEFRGTMLRLSTGL